MKKIVYDSTLKVFVIDFEYSRDNISVKIDDLKLEEQIIFLNLWNFCRLKVNTIRYLVCSINESLLNIESINEVVTLNLSEVEYIEEVLKIINTIIL